MKRFILQLALLALLVSNAHAVDTVWGPFTEMAIGADSVWVKTNAPGPPAEYWADTNSAMLAYYYPMTVTSGTMVATYPLTQYGDWAFRLPLNELTHYPGAFTNILGREGAYFTADGVDDMLRTAYTNGFQVAGTNLTIMAWFRSTTDPASWAFMFENPSGVGGRFIWAVDSDVANRMKFYDGTTGWGPPCATNTELLDGAWHHIAAVCNMDNTITLYFDGNHRGSWPWVAMAWKSPSGADWFGYNGAGYRTQGDVESLWFYTNCVGQTYIQAHCTNTSPASVNGDLYWRP